MDENQDDKTQSANTDNPDLAKPTSSTTPAKVADSRTDEIINDIVAKEGDEVLEANDAKIAKAFSGEKTSRWDAVKDFFSRWWKNPVTKWSTVGAGVLLLLLIAVLPVTRYFLLNLVSVRSKATVIVVDSSTQQTLKGVQVTLANKSTQTDGDGKASLSGVKLGATKLKIEKRGFATLEKKQTVGWGSNPLGRVSIIPKGTQFVLNAVDFLSNKPVKNVSAVSGEANAKADDKGVITITIDNPSDEVEITISGDGYRNEVVKFSATAKDAQTVKMVPGRKHAFVSKRTGKYDMYKIDADSKNEETVFAGSGTERDDMALVAHPTRDIVAFVSTHEGKRNSDGYLLSDLNIIDLKDSKINLVAQSERIQVVGWMGNKLIYVQIAAGASVANSKRNRLISFDYETNSNKEIATANYLNDIVIAQNKIYFAPASNFQTVANTGFFRLDADGSNKKTILSDETWSVFRTSYSTLAIAQQQNWYSYIITNSSLTKLSGAPANQSNRIYIDSLDGKTSLWVDTRDGKGTLQLYELSTAKDKTLIAKTGIKNPVLWLGTTTIVYRVTNGQETADYAFSSEGGEPKKIKDVTNTAGVDKWYYY